MLEEAVAPETVEAADTQVDEAAGPEPVEPWATGCRVVEDGHDTIALPEASGAARLPDGRILVVADSGNQGRALVLDPKGRAGAVGVTLPLGEGAGDDVEGLERAPDGRIWGITSAGWLRAWRVEPGPVPTFVLEVGPVPVAPDGDWRCDASRVNCGPNYEGLCLHPAPGPGACAGWAASKARGALVCLVPSEAGFEVDASRTVAVAPSEQLSGCAFEPAAPHRLVVAGNVMSGSTLWEVEPGSGIVVAWTAIGAANQEAVIVLDGGDVVSLGDLQDLTPESSPRVALRCPAAAARVESGR
ncbi:MAG: hypothetical protein IT385_08390 [Deltaproteobacteria bacterium]|nr:hypothetical protein [Deltaproteobacteria bacterium]